MCICRPEEMHVSVHVYIYIYIYMYIYIYVYSYICVYMYIYRQKQMHLCIDLKSINQDRLRTHVQNADPFGFLMLYWTTSLLAPWMRALLHAHTHTYTHTHTCTSAAYVIQRILQTKKIRAGKKPEPYSNQRLS